MIKISGSARLSFLFPADRALTYLYYSDMNRLVSHLQGIDLVHTYSDFEYRLYYHTVELGTYHIHAYCDARMDVVPGNRVIRIVPIENLPQVETLVTINSTQTRGYYSSEAIFHDKGKETQVEYTLTIQAKPPRPMGMRFMPRRIVDKIAKNITTHRIREIADHFIESSIAGFPAWREAYEQSLAEKKW